MSKDKMGVGSYTYTVIPRNMTVGKYSSIAVDCKFHNNGTHEYEKNKKVVFTTNWITHDVEPITIGSDVWICEGVRILDGITVGDGAILGAGAVISKDVPPYAVVVGNPQQIKRYRFSPAIIKRLLKIKWWDWDDDAIQASLKDMSDINLFLKKYS